MVQCFGVQVGFSIECCFEMREGLEQVPGRERDTLRHVEIQISEPRAIAKQEVSHPSEAAADFGDDWRLGGPCHLDDFPRIEVPQSSELVRTGARL